MNRQGGVFDKLLIAGLTLLVILAVVWLIQQEILGRQERRDQYRVFMREAWQIAPRAVNDLVRLQNRLSEMLAITDEVQLREELFEHARFLDARLRQSDEMRRRMYNLYPPPGLEGLHQGFSRFLDSMRSAEVSLRSVVGDLSPRRLEEVLLVIENVKRDLTLVPKINPNSETRIPKSE